MANEVVAVQKMINGDKTREYFEKVLKDNAQKSINWTIFIQLLRQHLRYDCDYKN